MCAAYLIVCVLQYPEVLGSILGALKAVVNVVGMTRMQPPIKELLPRLTPILKNRHEKVSAPAQCDIL
jgi:splicing factor 3B subunit 1